MVRADARIGGHTPARVRAGVLLHVSGWTVAALAVAAVLAVPLGAVLSSWRHPRWEVWRHLWDTQLAELLGNTLALLAGVGAGTLLLGTSLAWLVVAYRFPGSRVFEWALILPLAMPAYVIGFAVLGALDYAGPLQHELRRWLGPDARLPDLRSGGGVVAVMTLVFYPYVYLLARTAIREQGSAVLETARSLGRTRTRVWLDVVLPMARPSLVAGVSLAMMEALADFGTVATFGYRTLTEAVYRVWLGMFDQAAATQLAAVLLLIAFGLLALERALRGRARFVQRPRADAGMTPEPLHGWRAGAAVALCSAVLAFAFVLPVAQLLAWAREAVALDGLPLGRLTANSLTLAASASAATCALALILAYAARLHRSTVVRAAGQFVSMGYAVPGSVIAAGVLAPTALVDHLLVATVERWTGRPVGLVLTGSVATLLFAYVVRFLAVGYQAVEASLAKVAPSLDDAARALGTGPLGTWARVHLPLTRGGVLTALILVFVETMKEMPATLLLRPFGVDTLAVGVWERTAESLWAEAAIPALLIVAAGLLPVFVAIRVSGSPSGGRPTP
jgi:iron(III) transport system permease protein